MTVIIHNQFKKFSFALLLFLAISYISSLVAQTTKPEHPTQLPYNINYSSEVPLDEQVLILTDFGPIVIVLNVNDAPNATSLFVKLIRDKYYNNTSFYRMYNDYFIQAGDPGESGVGNAGIKFPEENQYNSNFLEGSVALANNNTNISSTGSQFFITFIRSPWLDGKYTIIGNVVSGLDTMRSFFGKYETDYKGIMHSTIPLQVFILEDYINNHPEYKSQFIATKFDKKSLLNELLSNKNNSTSSIIYNKEINIFDSVDSLLISPFDYLENIS